MSPLRQNRNLFWCPPTTWRQIVWEHKEITPKITQQIKIKNEIRGKHQSCSNCKNCPSVVDHFSSFQLSFCLHAFFLSFGPPEECLTTCLFPCSEENWSSSSLGTKGLSLSFPSYLTAGQYGQSPPLTQSSCACLFVTEIHKWAHCALEHGLGLETGTILSSYGNSTPR